MKRTLFSFTLLLGISTAMAAQTTPCAPPILADSTGNVIGVCTKFTTEPLGSQIYPPRALYTANTQDGTPILEGSVDVANNQVNAYLPTNPAAQFYGGATSLGGNGPVTSYQMTGKMPVYPSKTPVTLTYAWTFGLGTETIYDNSGQPSIDIAWSGTFTATYQFTGQYASFNHGAHVPLFQLQTSNGELDGIPTAQ